MSFALINEAIAMPLPPARRMVLLQLSRMANRAGACWPSVQTLARQCCLSVRSVSPNVRLLVAPPEIGDNPQRSAIHDKKSIFQRV